MSKKHVVFGQKVVTSHNILLDETTFLPISEEVKQIIRDSKIESLQGLLGPDAKSVAWELVQDYWRNK